MRSSYISRLAAVALCVLLALSGGCSPAPLIQGETDSLIVYIPKQQEGARNIEGAIKAFKRLYKNVEVTVEILDSSENDVKGIYEERLTAELMSGRGPDIVFVDNSTFPNIYKTIASGAFADLTPYLENDPEFRLTRYLPEVVDVGTLRGRRYVLPVCYYTPSMLSYSELVGEFDQETEPKASELLGLIGDYIESGGGDNVRPFSRKDTLRMYLTYCLPDCIDRATGKTTLPNDSFKALMEQAKRLYAADAAGEADDSYDDALTVDYLALAEGSGAFSMLMDTRGAMRLGSFIAGSGRTVIGTVMRDESGKIAAMAQWGVAIAKNSPNKLNAWRLISLMMDMDYQQNLPEAIPVHTIMSRVIIMRAWNSYSYAFSADTGAFGARISSETMFSYRTDVTNPAVCSFKDDMISSLVWTHMEQYFSGRRDYDDCVRDLAERINIYLSE